MDHNDIIDWLLQGDVSIAYLTARDLLDEDRPELQARIATEGWGKAYLDARNPDGSWGNSYYNPRYACSHYVLLELAQMGFPPDHPEVAALVTRIARDHVAKDGGLAITPGDGKSDVCVTAMFVYVGCHFRIPEPLLTGFIDFLLDSQLPDGGFNCQFNRRKVRRSSLHTTCSVLEALQAWQDAGHAHRQTEAQTAAQSGRALLLRHEFYKSLRTGQIISEDFLKFPTPARWHYNILRGLDHFRAAGCSYDPAMQDALDQLKALRRKDGRWLRMAKKPGVVFFELEPPRGAGRWNTLRALRVLRAFG